MISFSADAIQRLTGANQQRLAGNRQRGLRFAKELIAGHLLLFTAQPQDSRDSFAAGKVELAVSSQRARRIVAAKAVLPDQFASLGVEASRDAQRGNKIDFAASQNGR